MPAHSLIIVKIADVFECQPGPNARQKNPLILSIFHNHTIVMCHSGWCVYYGIKRLQNFCKGCPAGWREAFDKAAL